MEHPTPDGFKPLFRTSPFLDHNGPFFYFAGGAKVGAWVEAHVDVHKVGGRLPSPTAISSATASASSMPAPFLRGVATGRHDRRAHATLEPVLVRQEHLTLRSGPQDSVSKGGQR
jgi:hypothetical protein